MTAAPEIIDFEQYAITRFGPMASFMAYAQFEHVGPGNANNEPASRRRAREARLLTDMAENTRLREQAWAAYSHDIDAGRVRPPTRLETLMGQAQGNADNEGTQAARRLLAKHYGIVVEAVHS